MSAPTNILRQEQDAEAELERLIEAALDFSDIYESLERAEQLLEQAKKGGAK